MQSKLNVHVEKCSDITAGRHGGSVKTDAEQVDGRTNMDTKRVVSTARQAHTAAGKAQARTAARKAQDSGVISDKSWRSQQEDAVSSWG